MKKHSFDKIILIATTAFSTVALLSVGFASWQITASDQAISTSSFKTDTYVNLTGVSLSTDSTFTLGTYFFDNNDSLSATGAVIYNLNINSSQVDEAFLDNNVLTLRCSLKLGDSSTFADSINSIEKGIFDSTQQTYAYSTLAKNTSDESEVKFSITENLSSGSLISRKIKVTFNNKLCYKYYESVLNASIILHVEGGRQ